MADTVSTERLFPILEPDQIERVAVHGYIRAVKSGEVLVEPGAANTRLFIVKRGRLEIIWPDPDERVITSLGPGQFTGETSMLAGRRGLVRIRASEPGEVIEVQREQLLVLVQTDSDLSDIFMRTFILRRVELIARGYTSGVLLSDAK
jgi:thioredoxin reductase (NADPH)